MSDVYVAFVRDDQSYAEALAVALQGSGFSVSRSSSVVEAIEQCAAIVVLWTPAAARSKLFIDAADRAFRAGKMVLARMGNDPLPQMFAGAESHALGRWSGDPESPEIDSIVFHVDRLVNRGRPRGGAAEPPADTPRSGVVHPFPGAGGAMRAARPVEAPRPAAPPQAYPMAAPADPLAEEAAYWRRIQNSTDPNEFYAYLDRYGRGGTFAELAETRLRQLTPRPQRPPPTGAGMPGPIPQPLPMQAPPIGRGGFTMSPPAGGRAPPPLRADPPPLRPRDPEPEAPRGMGGGLRGLIFLVFLAIIGGGGYYIYSQLQGPPPAASADASDEPWSPPEGTPADPEPPGGEGVSVAAAAPRTPPPRATAPIERRAPAETEPPPPPPVFRTLAPAPTQPPPAATTADPGVDLARDVGPVAAPPPPAPVAAPAPATVAAAPAEPATVRPVWTRRPSGRDLQAAYPAAAARQGVEGRVVLDCLIGNDLAIRCRARSETPAGYGFATAALRVAQQFRAAPALADGRPAAGERATVALVFKPE